MNIREYLESLGREPTDIEIKVVSPARMRKKANPFIDVMKVQTIRGHVNYDYEQLMAKKEGAWVSNHRSWGKRIEGQCLITHKEELYVSVCIKDAGTSLYFNEHEVLSAEDLGPFLLPASKSFVRDINIKNIVLFR